MADYAYDSLLSWPGNLHFVISCLLTSCRQTIIHGNTFSLTLFLHLFIGCALCAKLVRIAVQLQGTANPLWVLGYNHTGQVYVSWQLLSELVAMKSINLIYGRSNSKVNLPIFKRFPNYMCEN